MPAVWLRHIYLNFIIFLPPLSTAFISCALCSSFCCSVIILGPLEVQINRGLGVCVMLQSAVLPAKQQEKQLTNKQGSSSQTPACLLFSNASHLVTFPNK